MLELIFYYQLETMPNPDYVKSQTEITWEIREVLVDWLLQVHLRYHMLPETLWIAVNIFDRFLTKRSVSLGKVQLVGVVALFIAVKYEEILAPTIDEFVALTKSGYSKEETIPLVPTRVGASGTRCGRCGPFATERAALVLASYFSFPGCLTSY